MGNKLLKVNINDVRYKAVPAPEKYGFINICQMSLKNFLKYI